MERERTLFFVHYIARERFGKDGMGWDSHHWDGELKVLGGAINHALLSVGVIFSN